MTLEAIEIETGDDPRASVIVLHGLGADGDDFVPVCEALELGAAGPVRFVLPHAPERPVTINGGYVMRAWYDILGLGGASVEDESGLRASIGDVNALIAREVSRGVPPSRIALVGFSQGCAIALATALRHAGPLAGVAGLSGYLPLAASTAAERSEASLALPIFLAHGSDDDVVPIARGERSREALAALGHAPEWHDYPMPHAVCDEEIADLNHWLVRVLG